MPTNESQEKGKGQTFGWIGGIQRSIKEGVINSITEAVGGSLMSKSIPTISKSVFSEKRNLDYVMAKNIQRIEEEYIKNLQNMGLPYIQDYIRVTINFVTHNMKNLRNYRDAILHCVRSFEEKRLEFYKTKLIKLLNLIIKDCEHSSLKGLTFEKYKAYLSGEPGKRDKVDSITIIEKSLLIGDFANELKEFAEKMKAKLKNIGSEGFVGLLSGGKKMTNRLKKMGKKIKRLNPVNNAINGVVSRTKNLLSGAVGAAMDNVGRAIMLRKVVLYPVEYFEFKDKRLGISVVHSVTNILLSYRKTVKSYPNEMINYVDKCKEYIDKLMKIFKKYESCLKVFSKLFASSSSKAKAILKIEELLDEMLALNNEFQKGKKDLLDIIPKKTMEGKDIKINGWNLWEFFEAFSGCIQNTKDALEEFDLKEYNNIDLKTFTVKSSKTEKK